MGYLCLWIFVIFLEIADRTFEYNLWGLDCGAEGGCGDEDSTNQTTELILRGQKFDKNDRFIL